MSHRTELDTLKLSGSPNLRRALALPAVDAKYHDPGEPVPPEDLSQAERVVFARIAATLSDRNVVTAGDAECLSQYAVVYCRWQRERELLDKEGTVVSKLARLSANHTGEFETVINPRLKVVRGCELQLVQLQIQLCLTPRTRGSVKPTKKEKTADDFIRQADEMLASLAKSN